METGGVSPEISVPESKDFFVQLTDHFHQYGDSEYTPRILQDRIHILGKGIQEMLQDTEFMQEIETELDHIGQPRSENDASSRQYTSHGISLIPYGGYGTDHPTQRLSYYFNQIADSVKHSSDVREFDLVVYPMSGSDTFTPTRLGTNIVSIDENDIFALPHERSFGSKEELRRSIKELMLRKVTTGMESYIPPPGAMSLALNLYLSGVDFSREENFSVHTIHTEGPSDTKKFQHIDMTYTLIDGKSIQHTHFNTVHISDLYYFTHNEEGKFISAQLQEIFKDKENIICLKKAGMYAGLAVLPLYPILPNCSIILSDSPEEKSDIPTEMRKSYVLTDINDKHDGRLAALTENVLIKSIDTHGFMDDPWLSFGYLKEVQNLGVFRLTKTEVQ